MRNRESQDPLAGMVDAVVYGVALLGKTDSINDGLYAWQGSLLGLDF